jgi:hypothetical protein
VDFGRDHLNLQFTAKIRLVEPAQDGTRLIGPPCVKKRTLARSHFSWNMHPYKHSSALFELLTTPLVPDYRQLLEYLIMLALDPLIVVGPHLESTKIGGELSGWRVCKLRSGGVTVTIPNHGWRPHQ